MCLYLLVRCVKVSLWSGTTIYHIKYHCKYLNTYIGLLFAIKSALFVTNSLKFSNSQ